MRAKATKVFETLSTKFGMVSANPWGRGIRGAPNSGGSTYAHME